MVDTAMADLFSGLTVEAASEPLPKRTVGGRESIPNPFLTAVHDSYAEAIDPAIGEAKATRQIFVPVDGKGMTWKDTKRKNKAGQEVSTGRWQQHPNVTTALYLLRQAAIKNECGVRIVVDYKDGNAGEHLLAVKSGKVRVRFVGKTRKATDKADNSPTGETAAA